MSGGKKPVVLFINHWAKREGGAEHSLLDLLSFLRFKYTCHLTTTEHGPLIDKALKIDIQCHVIHCIESLEKISRLNLISSLLSRWDILFAYAIYLYRLRKLIRLINPVVIHANVPKSHISVFLLARTGIKSKLCIHIRELFQKNSFSLFIYKILFPKNICKIIAVSESVKKHLPLSLRKKTTVIYNGVIIPVTKKHYHKLPPFKLLYLGRIVPWKGCHLLIDILYMLHNKYPFLKIELSIIGDTLYWTSEYRKDLTRKINSMHLSEYCRLLPFTEDTVSIYQSHDIFCNVSVNEPFGRVVAEASACGLPVVAFNSGGISEIVEHNKTGILIPYKDIKKFAEAVYKLSITPSLIKKMGCYGRERTELLFDREKQNKQIHKFFSNEKLL